MSGLYADTTGTDGWWCCQGSTHVCVFPNCDHAATSCLVVLLSNLHYQDCAPKFWGKRNASCLKLLLSDFFHRKGKNNEENRSQEWCPYYDDRSDHVLPRIFRNWLARGVWKNLERWDRQAINCWNVFRKVKKMKTVEVWIMKFLIETRVLLRTGPVSFMLYSGREFDYILLMSWEFEWSQIRNWWTKVFGGGEGVSRLDIIQSVPWFLLTA